MDGKTDRGRIAPNADRDAASRSIPLPARRATVAPDPALAAQVALQAKPSSSRALSQSAMLGALQRRASIRAAAAAAFVAEFQPAGNGGLGARPSYWFSAAILARNPIGATRFVPSPG